MNTYFQWVRGELAAAALAAFVAVHLGKLRLPVEANKRRKDGGTDFNARSTPSHQAAAGGADSNQVMQRGGSVFQP
jgi:hypothetical protein